MKNCINCERQISKKDHHKRCRTCRSDPKIPCPVCSSPMGANSNKCRKCYSSTLSGEDNPVWKGGLSKSSAGYILVRLVEEKRYIFQHILVMQRYLGRELVSGENVHHINGDRTDNKIENLELWNTSQPAGQRIEDKLEWAKHIIDLYG